jgi:hypothetical protein
LDLRYFWNDLVSFRACALDRYTKQEGKPISLKQKLSALHFRLSALLDFLIRSH